jgi:hypothetical protein
MPSVNQPPVCRLSTPKVSSPACPRTRSLGQQLTFKVTGQVASFIWLRSKEWSVPACSSIAKLEVINS